MWSYTRLNSPKCITLLGVSFFLVLFFYLNLHGDSDLEDCTLNSSTKLDAHHVGLYKVDSLKDIMAQSVFFYSSFFLKILTLIVTLTSKAAIQAFSTMLFSDAPTCKILWQKVQKIPHRQRARWMELLTSSLSSVLRV